MKHLFSILFLVLISSSKLMTQSDIPRTIDSLKTIIDTTKNDTIKLNALSTITQKYWSISPPDGLPLPPKRLILQKR